MSDKWKTRLVKYAFSTAFVVLTGMIYLRLQGFEEAELVDRYRLLCDAFSVPGVLLIMFGALVWASNEGALLGVSYVARQAVFALIPGKRLEREEKYGDYVARKRDNQVTGYGFLFYTGLVALGIAGIFMVLFYLVY